MERVQRKGIWSQERIAFRMDNTNGLLERERLTLQKLKRKDSVWEEPSRGLGCCSEEVHSICERGKKEMCGNRGLLHTVAGS